MSRFDRPPHFLAVALAVALGGGLYACDKGAGGVALPGAPPAADHEPPAVDGAEGGEATASQPPASTTPKAPKITVHGTTEAHRMSTLRSKVTGLVAEVHVVDGQAVKAGDPLVTLDTSDLELHLKSAKAALRTAQAQVRAIRIEAERARRLVADKALPKANREQAESQLSVARAGVGQARVGVQMADKALADSVIKAPYDAVIVKRHVAEGDYAAAMPPQPIATLQEIDPIDLRLVVPAVHQLRVRAGERVKIRFPHSGLEREGTIDRVVPAIDPRTRALTAVVELANPDGALFPGMFAEVDLAAAGVAASAGRDAEGAR
ncbi:MAG: hypothetical protein CSA66_00925 [Proteobacteria bacterium]|nr:MAG: hypothetical protein CSA66_00925 [Pseudomonadota bacterium]